MSTPTRRVSAARASCAREAGRKRASTSTTDFGESVGYFIVALADDQKPVAPVDSPQTVRFQIGKQEPGRACVLSGGHDRWPASTRCGQTRPNVSSARRFMFIAP